MNSIRTSQAWLKAIESFSMSPTNSVMIMIINL